MLIRNNDKQKASVDKTIHWQSKIKKIRKQGNSFLREMLSFFRITSRQLDAAGII